jgi:anti-sigma factor RsiW
MTESAHLGDAIHELLDGRLAPEARARAEAHLAECARCRQELEAVRWVKGVAARGAAKRDVPPSLASAISSALDGEDRGEDAPSARKAVAWRAVRPALALGLLVLVAVAVLLWRGRGATDLPTAVARDYSRYRDGGLSLGLRTTDTHGLEQFFAANGITFETRVFDLGMMGYRVVGGRVHAVNGRPSALFVYEGEGGRLLLCQMFEGRLSELPPAETVREHNGIRFHVHHKDGLTMVFWQEGEVVCVLAAEIPSEEVIQLAFGKAVRVARGSLARTVKSCL